MAHPRIFISSTYFDLKNVRADIERYVKDRAFDPVLNERGHVPFGSESELEDYCYMEIEQCDILISIIGGRYGSDSAHGPYSISQKELKKAIELGRPVYIFVEKNVLAEYETYKKNKDSDDITYAAVDNPAIYKFMDEVYALPLNNPVAPFETSSDITVYLQEQWSGLFKRLLQSMSRQKEIGILEDLKGTVQTLNQLVRILSEESQNENQTIVDILLNNHPIFNAIQKAIDVPYRVFFTNKNELYALLKARKYSPLDPEEWDEETAHTHEEWVRSGNPNHLLKIANSVFDDNDKLRVFTPDKWEEGWITDYEYGSSSESEDLPF